MAPAWTSGPEVPAWAALDWRPYLHDVEISGRSVRYLDYGSGPVLVLVHGLGGAWQNWIQNVPVLGSEFRVIAIDLPGFGASERLAHPGDIDDYVRAVERLVEVLEIGPFVLVGHSMGGLIVTRFAIAHSEQLAGLVLVCAGGIVLGRLRLMAIVGGFTVFSWCLRRPGWAETISRRPRLRRALFGSALGRSDALTAAMALQVIPPMAAAPGFGDGLMAGARAANDSEPETITVPTLLIWGSKDPILPVAKAREMAARMSDAELVELDGVGHCPMFEAADAFDDALGAFARRVEPISDAAA